MRIGGADRRQPTGLGCRVPTVASGDQYSATTHRAQVPENAGSDLASAREATRENREERGHWRVKTADFSGCPSRGDGPEPRQHWRFGQKKTQPRTVGFWGSGGGAATGIELRYMRQIRGLRSSAGTSEKQHRAQARQCQPLGPPVSGRFGRRPDPSRTESAPPHKVGPSSPSWPDRSVAPPSAFARRRGQLNGDPGCALP